jgi:hypothetical protein
LPEVKISPEWATGPEQGKSSGRIATFNLWAGMFRELKITPILEKLLEYERSWIQHVNGISK